MLEIYWKLVKMDLENIKNEYYKLIDVEKTMYILNNSKITQLSDNKMMVSLSLEGYEYIQNNVLNIINSIIKKHNLDFNILLSFDPALSLENIQKSQNKESIYEEEIIEEKTKEDTIYSEFISMNNLRETKNSEEEEIYEQDRLEKIIDEKIKEAELIKEYSLDKFVGGENSQIALNLCENIRKNQEELKNGLTDKIRCNPFFIFGSPGVGKTHLAQGLAIDLIRMDINTRVLYITAETFSNDFLTGLRNSKDTILTSSNFRKRYRNVDVLIIDDIQFFENIFGKGQGTVEEEFFHTFNTLVENRKRVILVSDRRPEDIKNFSDRLKSRIKSSTTAHMQEPLIETKYNILLKLREEVEDIKIDDSVLRYMANNIHESVRELKGMFENIISHAEATLKNEITIEFAQEKILERIKKEKDKITADRILSIISEHYGITKIELINGKRLKKTGEPLKMAMFILKELLDISYTEIATLLNKKTHSTILKSNRKFENLLLTENEVKIEYDDIINKIKFNNK